MHLAVVTSCAGARGTDDIEVVPVPAAMIEIPSAPTVGGSREDAGLDRPEPLPDKPSLAFPLGLSQSGRDRFNWLTQLLMSIYADLETIEPDLPLECAISEPSCREAWRIIAGRLLLALNKIGPGYLRCDGLHPVDSRALEQRAVEHYRYIIAVVERLDREIERQIRERRWGPRASRLWREHGVVAALDAAQEPRCRRAEKAPVP
jgi:hypothetical protein